MSNAEIKIRSVARNDIESCLKLSQIKELELGPKSFPTEAELISGFEKGIFLVAESDSKIIGFVLGYVLSRQNGYIDLLVVDRDHRGMGIGTKLLDEIIKKFKSQDVEDVWLIAHETDLDLHFYAERHFKQGDRFRLFWKEI